MKKIQAGFSLVELLVALGVLGVVFVALTGLFSSSVRTSRVAVNSSQIQQELLIAGNIIGDEIQRAIYIFPPDTTTIDTSEGTQITVDWSSFKLGSSNLKTGPHEKNGLDCDKPTNQHCSNFFGNDCCTHKS